jgi:two-component system, sensor histidine kinase and response regulator
MISNTPDPNLKPINTARSPRILVVDDQRESVRLLQMRLQVEGFECVTAADGPAALDLMFRQPIDLVILDVVMPKMDGYEVCRRIKADERTRDIPVLFLTAKLEIEAKVRGLEAGGHDYLSKPVDQLELLARTRAALRVKQLQDQLKNQLQLQDQINRLHQRMLSEHWEKTLGQLAASLAHEINNPLTAALGNVQVLTMDPTLEPALKDRLGIVDLSLQRVGQKLRSLLLITQTNSDPQTVSVAEMVEDLLTLLNFQLVMDKVSVRTTLDHSCMWRGVAGDLACGILYVLNNAIEAMAGRSGAILTISVEGGQDGLVVRIGDNGTGIPIEIQPMIFEPFFTTKSGLHHGVGLYLAKEIVTKAGGRILFESEAQGGRTEFRIWLPARFLEF